MKALQTRILKLLNNEPEESMSTADVIAMGMSARGLARALNVSKEDVTEGISKITNLVLYKVGDTEYCFRTEKSEALLAQVKPKDRLDSQPLEPSQQSSPRGDDTLTRPNRTDTFLNVLAAIEGPTTVSQICKKLGLAYNQVHPILETIYKSGYAIREKRKEECPTCGHVLGGNWYTLTKEGKRVLEKLEK